FEIRILMLGVSFSQTDSDRPSMRELLGLIDVELVVIALTLFLKHHEFIVGLGDGALKHCPGGGQVLLCSVNCLALSVELRLELLPARIRLGKAYNRRMDMRRMTRHRCSRSAPHNLD